MVFLLFLFIAVGLSFLHLYGILFVLLVGGGVLVFQKTTLNKIELIWLITLGSAFLGSYLGIPGRESIFLFRILLVVFLCLCPSYFLKEYKGRQSDKIVLSLLMVWLIGCVCTLFWSKHLVFALRHFYYTLEASSLVFLTSYFLKSKRIFQQVCQIITGIYVLSIGLGFFEVFFGIHLKFSGALVYETMTSQFQPTGFLFNTNDYAIYLALFLPFVFNYLYTILNRNWSKLAAIFLWLSSIYLIISSYSRLGIISIVLVSIAIFGYYFYRYTFMLLLGVVTGFLIGDRFFEKLTRKIFLSFTTKGRSSEDRLDLYRISVEIARENHFLGAGLGSVPVEIAEIRKGYETFPVVIAAPHNFFLELIGEMGIFSLSFFLLLLVALFQAGQFVLRGKLFFYCIPLLMLLVFLFGGVALSTIIEQRFLWIGLGIILAIPNIEWMDSNGHR